MTAWSRSEAARTIEEVKRRSRTDPEFRALAIADPISALTKVNPRPVPAGSVRFVAAGDEAQEINNSDIIVAILPEPAAEGEELSEDELENVAGGGNTPPPPPVGIS